jgi:hypothetical protein
VDRSQCFSTLICQRDLLLYQQKPLSDHSLAYHLVYVADLPVPTFV